MDITFDFITKDNFNLCSLDGFARHQRVTECWRKINGEYRLMPCSFVDDWPAERKRQIAAEILDGDFITFGAFDEDRVIGFAMLKRQLNADKMILDSLQVSEEYRHRGIGRKLFSLAVIEARANGANKLYISACSSNETIAFYKAMGCILAEEVIPEMADDEPFDLQLEYSVVI